MDVTPDAPGGAIQCRSARAQKLRESALSAPQPQRLCELIAAMRNEALSMKKRDEAAETLRKTIRTAAKGWVSERFKNLTAQDLDDVVQEVFVEILKPRQTGEENTWSWLDARTSTGFSIVRKLVLRIVSRKLSAEVGQTRAKTAHNAESREEARNLRQEKLARREALSLDAELLGEALSTDDDPQRRIERQAVWECLRKHLGESKAELVFRRYGEEYAPMDLARLALSHMSCSVGDENELVKKKATTIRVWTNGFLKQMKEESYPLRQELLKIYSA